MNRKVLGIIILVVVIVMALIIGILFKSKSESNNDVVNSITPYIPNEVNTANGNDIEVQTDSIELNQNKENVSIEVLLNTITTESAEILITDNNENQYGWGDYFKVQKKANDNWEDLKWLREDFRFTALGYKLGESNQLKMKINYGDYYGKLEKGIYRIVKRVYAEKYIEFYSNEFEIK